MRSVWNNQFSQTPSNVAQTLPIPGKLQPGLEQGNGKSMGDSICAIFHVVSHLSDSCYNKYISIIHFVVK